ncbi:MAG: glycoside hydrolase family 2 TIM barrel-domain containing protein [Phycisphaerales bacterium]|nr:cellulase family glycosylhydrolase [Planctomycetota bacterium]
MQLFASKPGKSHLGAVLIGAIAFAASVPAELACGAPVKVELVQKDGRWQLMREGKPYFVRGGGGDGDVKTLAAAGGNSKRTWGADNIEKVLDEAQAAGLTVAVGIWLEHERHGFNYGDEKAVRAQFEKAKAAVMKYKDHPAVLLWGVGNEMEGYEKGDNPKIWKAVNDIAKMIKEVDPNHPTMTVIAEIGGEKLPSIRKYCPDIDIVGLNSYGGVLSLPDRYHASGMTKPFMVTEFGPPGTWETPKNSFGVTPEKTSTEKAAIYRDAAIKFEKDSLCLGSYAFIWDNKREATMTWFGLFLPPPGRERTAGIDALQEVWTGKPPANRVPVVEPLKLLTKDDVKAGETVSATLKASDPDGDPIRVNWVLQSELDPSVGGDAVAERPSYPQAIVKSSNSDVTVKMPEQGGVYRLYAYVTDNHGGGAVANVPLHVTGANAGSAPKPTLPMVIYAEGSEGAYAASGWMGNTGAISMDGKCSDRPHSGASCLKVQYNAPDNWGGVAYQSPANDWGDQPGGYDLSAARKLSFWARGEAGGENVEFKVGLIGNDKKYHDTAALSKKVTLTKEWKLYEIDLKDNNLSCIKTGFVWSVGGQGKPVVFYLDDVRFE